MKVIRARHWRLVASFLVIGLAVAVLTAGLGAARMQAASLRSNATDPEIRHITITSDLTLYDPTDGGGATNIAQFGAQGHGSEIRPEVGLAGAPFAPHAPVVGTTGEAAFVDHPSTQTGLAETGSAAPMTNLGVFSLTVNYVGEGTVTKEPDAEAYESGTIMTLTATSDPGWIFEAWSGDVEGNDEVTTHTIVANTVVTATFEAIPYALDVKTAGEGTVDANPDEETYTYGDVVTLTATANTGWIFEAWSGDVEGTDTVITHSIVANTVVTATFAETVRNIYLPAVAKGYRRFCNGDFSYGWACWDYGCGGFAIDDEEFGTGLPRKVVDMESSPGGRMARLGNPEFQDGEIPVGYGYIAQTFTVPADKPVLRFSYQVETYDVVAGPETGRYFDTFEVSIDREPSAISRHDRDARGCYEEWLNPEGSVGIDGKGLVFCGGRSPEFEPGTLFDTRWNEVELDLSSFQGQTITLYIAIWSREYDDPFKNDQAFFNTWAHVRDFKLEASD